MILSILVLAYKFISYFKPFFCIILQNYNNTVKLLNAVEITKLSIDLHFSIKTFRDILIKIIKSVVLYTYIS